MRKWEVTLENGSKYEVQTEGDTPPSEADLQAYLSSQPQQQQQQLQPGELPSRSLPSGMWEAFKSGPHAFKQGVVDSALFGRELAEKGPDWLKKLAEIPLPLEELRAASTQGQETNPYIPSKETEESYLRYMLEHGVSSTIPSLAGMLAGGVAAGPWGAALTPSLMFGGQSGLEALQETEDLDMSEGKKLGYALTRAGVTAGSEGLGNALTLLTFGLGRGLGLGKTLESLVPKKLLSKLILGSVVEGTEESGEGAGSRVAKSQFGVPNELSFTEEVLKPFGPGVVGGLAQGGALAGTKKVLDSLAKPPQQPKVDLTKIEETYKELMKNVETQQQVPQQEEFAEFKKDLEILAEVAKTRQQEETKKVAERAGLPVPNFKHQPSQEGIEQPVPKPPPTPPPTITPANALLDVFRNYAKAGRDIPVGIVNTDSSREFVQSLGYTYNAEKKKFVHPQAQFSLASPLPTKEPVQGALVQAPPAISQPQIPTPTNPPSGQVMSFEEAMTTGKEITPEEHRRIQSLTVQQAVEEVKQKFGIKSKKELSKGAENYIGFLRSHADPKTKDDSRAIKRGNLEEFVKHLLIEDGPAVNALNQAKSELLPPVVEKAPSVLPAKEGTPVNPTQEGPGGRAQTKPPKVQSETKTETKEYHKEVKKFREHYKKNNEHDVKFDFQFPRGLENFKMVMHKLRPYMSTGQRALANDLLKFFNNKPNKSPRVVVGSIGVMDRKGETTLIAGQFDPNQPQPIIRFDYNILDNHPAMSAQVFLHELHHAATVEAIHNPANKRIRDKIEDLMEYVKKKNPRDYEPYGLTDVYEFVTEAYNNRSFQNLLQHIYIPRRLQSGEIENVSVFKQFAEFVRQLLNGRSATALEEVIKLTDTLVKEQELNTAESVLDSQTELMGQFNVLVHRLQGDLSTFIAKDKPADQVLGYLKNKYAGSDELAVSGLVPYLEGKGKERVGFEELKKIADENLPKVEVKVIYAQETVSDTAKLKAKLEHELDTINPNWRDLSFEDVFQSSDERFQKVWHDYHDIEDGYLEGFLGESATARYTMVNPKLLNEMEGAVDLLVRIPWKPEALGVRPDASSSMWTASEKAQAGLKYESGHYPTEGKNLVTHVRAYIETLPDPSLFETKHFKESFDAAAKLLYQGKKTEALIAFKVITDEVNASVRGSADYSSDFTPEALAELAKKRSKKVFHVFEVQSDWAQEVRESRETAKKAGQAPGRYVREHDDPILPHYERLALKAAIDYAKGQGADAIAISDAETVMMTQQHDRHGMQEMLPAMSHTEKGMRLHYDQTLPKIAKELTGSEGERVEFGEHQNAFEKGFPSDAEPGAGEWARTEQTNRLRKDLLFKNPDGSPKTSISARLYPIDRVPNQLSIFGKDKLPKLQTLVSSKLPDPPTEKASRIFDFTKFHPDLFAWKEWFQDVERLFKATPISTQVTQSVERLLDASFATGKDIDALLLNIKRNKLKESDLIQITSALRKVMNKVDETAVEKLNDQQRDFAHQVQILLEDFRQRIIDSNKAKIAQKLKGARKKMFDELVAHGSLEGVDVKALGEKYKLKPIGVNVVVDNFNQYLETDSWGVQDYIPNVEMGRYLIRIEVENDEGKSFLQTIAVAKTRAEAREKGEMVARTLTDYNGPIMLYDKNNPTSNVKYRGSKHAKYSPFLQRKLGILEGEENIMDVLPSYISSINRTLALNPLLAQQERLRNQLKTDAQKNAFDRWVETVKGKKSVLDDMVDGLFGTTMGATRVSGQLMKWSAYDKLGLRPLAGMWNFAGGQIVNLTELKPHYYLEGWKMSKTTEGKKLWEENEGKLGMTATLSDEWERGNLRKFVTGKTSTVPDPMLTFSWPEVYNRQVIFLGTYQALTDAGVKKEEALAEARQVTRFAQGIYSVASAPRLMRGPALRVAFQFKKFITTHLQWIWDLPTEKKMKYAGLMTLVGGPQAWVYMVKSLPFIGIWGGWDDAEKWLDETFGDYSKGLVGLFGVDAVPSLVAELPKIHEIEDWLGPTFGVLPKIWKGIISPGMEGKGVGWEGVSDTFTKISPLWRNWSRLVESTLRKDGMIVDERARIEFKPTTADKFKYLLGGRPIEQSREQLKSRTILRRENIARTRDRVAIDAVLRALDKDDDKAIEVAIDRARELGISADTIREARRDKYLTPAERALRGAKKARRENYSLE